MTNGVLDLLLPPACAGCGRLGAVLCDRCRRRFERPARTVDRFIVADAGAVIGEHMTLALAAFAYAGPMRRALAALKYGGVARLAPALADAAASHLHQLQQVAGAAALVPVPVHQERLRERGYNQAALLATSLGRGAKLPVADVLARARPTTKQHRLTRAARLANLRGAFTASGRAPRVAILVDDIITTTATLEACAAVLQTAGCDEVYGFAIAREV